MQFIKFAYTETPINHLPVWNSLSWKFQAEIAKN